jgi:hypothetical protein
MGVGAVKAGGKTKKKSAFCEQKYIHKMHAGFD